MSCQHRVICPAFQSTYILDDSTRNAYFSYVWQLDETTRAQYLSQQRSGGSTDTLNTIAQPKTDYYAYAGEKVVPWRTQKRTKYGIIKNTPFPIKTYQLRTAPMENVMGPEVVSNEFVAEDFGVDSLYLAGGDSLSFDSLRVSSVAAEEAVEDGPRFLYGYQPDDIFNVEQEYYNKYFGDQLLDKRPPKPEAPQVETDSLGNVIADSVSTKEPFFKGLFKKKDKKDQSEEDTESANPATETSGTTEEESSEEEENG
ncbi:MAG: hypothetical protein HRT61_12590 [Ekhidna sp.]|nr:hypothetical protein [Ekhidna sp.]